MIFLFFGQYKEMGYLPQAMVNYLALLGWGDGTENEFFTIGDLGLSATIHSVIFTRIFFFMHPHFGPISHL
jgi:glutamyl/glutaminyl-tRNA synthetase